MRGDEMAEALRYSGPTNWWPRECAGRNASVDAEQTSKRTMCRPTRQPFRGRADTAGRRRAKSTSSCCTGAVAADMHTRKAYATPWKPQGVVKDDQPDAREERAGRSGVAERFVGIAEAG